MRSKVLTVIGFTMLIGFATIGFFAIPIGITVCPIIGLCYDLFPNLALSHAPLLID